MKAALGAVLFYLFFAAPSPVSLPQSFAGWQSQKVDSIPATLLNDVAGQDADLVREYGFVQAQRRDYAKQNSHLVVTLWKMQDTTASYGLFTYFRQPGMTTQEGSDEVATGPDLLLLQRGPYLVEARGSGLSQDDATLLAAQVPVVKGREALLPPLPDYFPKQGLVPSSQKFAIGPAALQSAEQKVPASAIGFDAGAEAAVAEYRVGKGSAQMLLVSYPTPQFAESKLRALQQLPALQQAGNSIVFGRKGSLLAFVLDSPNADAARRLMDNVRYGTDITWNEYVAPRHQNVGSMMGAIFSLAGLLLLFSCVAGLAFGGVRALAKRFIPIPIFDRPSQTEIIRLNIAQK